MIARLTFAISCVALSTIFVYADTLSTVVPLQAKGHSLSAETMINGSIKARLLIDTGSSLTVITKKLAKKLGLHDIDKAPRYPVETATGIVWGQLILLSSVKVGNLEVRNVEAAIFQRPPAGVDGILGLSFLNNFVYGIDGPGSKLTLKTADESGKLYGGRDAKWWRSRIGGLTTRIERFKGYRNALDRSIKAPKRGIEKLTRPDIDGIIRFYEHLLTKLIAEAKTLGVPDA